MKNIDKISVQEWKILCAYMFLNGLPSEWKFNKEVTTEIYNSLEFSLFLFAYHLRILRKQILKILLSAWKRILGESK